jgi:hypothetical protein
VNGAEEPWVIVAGPDCGIPGSRAFSCAVCRAEVWLAPSSQAYQRTGIPVICVACAESLMRSGDGKPAIAAGAIEELRAYRAEKN